MHQPIRCLCIIHTDPASGIVSAVGKDDAATVDGSQDTLVTQSLQKVPWIEETKSGEKESRDCRSDCANSRSDN